MSYVWEEEYLHEPRKIAEPKRFGVIEWHLKKQIPPPDRERFWKISVAVVRKIGDRKYHVWFVRGEYSTNDKTFRSLKQAKAYATAIITLEQ